ncbi:hypothetical protein B7494_g2195 [Chlorociboria aeruginascens]|nr:hypothetical protein B7494_g2195 [Chlorociboria aeruginascens]
MCQEYYYLWTCDHLTQDFIPCGRQPECRWNPKRNVVRNERCYECNRSRERRRDRANPNPGLRQSFLSDLERQNIYFDEVREAERQSRTYHRLLRNLERDMREVQIYRLQQQRREAEEAVLVSIPPRDLNPEQVFRMRFLYSELLADVHESHDLEEEHRHRLARLAIAVLDPRNREQYGFHPRELVTPINSSLRHDTMQPDDGRDAFARLMRDASLSGRLDDEDSIPAAADEFVPTSVADEEQARRRRVIPNILTRAPTVSCSICQETQTRDAVQLPCSHGFCRDCITNWMVTSDICPNCRRDFGHSLR